MSNGNRRYIAAIGGCLALLLGGSSLHEGQAGQPAEQRPQPGVNAQADPQEAKSQPALSPPQQKTSGQASAAAQKTDEHRREGPDWTDVITALTAVIVAIFTAVLTFVGWEQWKLLRDSRQESANALAVAKQSADAAAALAKAAAAANELTRQQFLEQHRPRITASGVAVGSATVETNGTLVVGIRVSGKNAGNIPGSDVSCHFMVAAVEDAIEPAKVFEALLVDVIAKVSNKWAVATTLSAGEEEPLISLSVVIPPADVAAVMKRDPPNFSAAGLIHYTYSLPPVPKNSMFWIVVTYRGDPKNLAVPGTLKRTDFTVERIPMLDFQI